MATYGATGRVHVKLTAGGRISAQPLIVRKDPNSRRSDADVQTRRRILRDLQSDLDRRRGHGEPIEVIRSSVWRNLLGVRAAGVTRHR